MDTYHLGRYHLVPAAQTWGLCYMFYKLFNLTGTTLTGNIASTPRATSFFPDDVSRRIERQGDLDADILNALALLFVTEGHGDVAAVSIITKPSHLEIIVAKNRPLEEHERDHVEALMNITEQIALGTPRAKCSEKLFTQILTGCRQKILSRIFKVQDEIKNSLEDIDKRCREDLETYPMGEQYGSIMGDNQFLDCLDITQCSEDSTDPLPPLTGILCRVLEAFLDFSKDARIIDLNTAVTLAYFLGDDILEDLMGAVLVWRFKKLGEYYLAWLLLMYCARIPAYRPLIVEMELVTQRETDVAGPPLELGPDPRPRPRSRSGFRKIYAEGITPIEDSKTEPEPHYECRLAYFLQQRYPNQRNFQIGVSKLCCWICNEWLKSYGREPKIGSRRFTIFHKYGAYGHKEVSRDWHRPGPSCADAVVHDVAFQRVQNELWRIGFIEESKEIT
ncbi:hypothetical protein TWF481_000588 [Arthrobotrys musiformis]|uniref:DUF4470 domain-containing protein n=1 Tax=Arthrobotrys musiformis TaxID=47236 RepID=A0AAV9WN08_9PEZI